jgi:ATP-binding cassette subfamily B protein
MSKTADQSSNTPPPLSMPGRPGGSGGNRRGAPIVKPRNFKETMKRLWHYFGNERKMLNIVFLFILLSSALSLLSPFLIGKAIDAISLDNKVDFNFLEVMVMILISAFILDAVLTFLQGWLMAGVSQRIVKRLRNALFNKLQKLPVAFFDQRTHGELMSRLSNDIDNVSSTISQSTTQLMSGVIVISGSFIMMLILSPILTVASLVTVPLVFLLTKTIAKRTSVLFKDQQIQHWLQWY